MTTPTKTDTGVDPWLTQRLDAEIRLVEAERVLFDEWWKAYATWLAAVRRGVLAGPAPDLHALWAHTPLWSDLMATFIAGPVTNVVGWGYTPIFGNTYPYTERPAVVAHLDAVATRVRGVPDQVHGRLTTLVATMASAGDPGPDILAAVTDALTPKPPVRDLYAMTAADPTDAGHALVTVAETLPRTEAMSALNAGRADAFAAVNQELGGSLLNMWLCTLDSRTRPEHLEADGQRVAQDEPFIVGGEELMYPGDPAGSAAMTINCRCTMLLVEPDEEIDMSDRGWQDWEDELGEDSGESSATEADFDAAASERDAFLAAPRRLGSADNPLAIVGGGADDWGKTERRAAFTALTDHKGAYYVALNAHLRGEYPSWATADWISGQKRLKLHLTPAEAKRRVKVIDAALSRSRLTSDVVLWRGSQIEQSIFGDRIAGNLTGFEWAEQGYMSSSADRGIAEKFANIGDDPGVLVRLLVRRNVGAVGLEPLDRYGEAEVLLQRGLRLRVVRDHGTVTPPRVVGAIFQPRPMRVLDVEAIA